MKKFIFNTALVLLAIMAFSSCNDNGDRFTILYNITLSEDMAQIADLALTYKGDNGITVTDTITGKTWEKRVHLDSLPNQFGLVDYTFILKPGSQLKKESYDLEASFSIFSRVNNFGLYYYLVNPYNLKRDKMATFFDLVNNHGDQSLLITATKSNDSIQFSGKNRLDVNLLLKEDFESHREVWKEENQANSIAQE